MNAKKKVGGAGVKASAGVKKAGTGLKKKADATPIRVAGSSLQKTKASPKTNVKSAATKPAVKSKGSAASLRSNVVKKETPAEKRKREKKEAALEKEEQEKSAARAKEINDRLKAEKEEQEQKAREAKEAKQKELTPNDLGERHIRLERLEDAMEAVYAEGKTPIIIDPEGRADSFLQYQRVATLDCKGIFLKVGVHKTVSKDEMLEELRKKVVNACKAGLMIHFCMQNGATYMTDYDDKDHFPLKLILTPGGLTEESTKEIVRKSDMDYNGFFICKETNAVITTQFEAADYKEFLQEALPLDLCAPIVVKPSK